MIERYWSPTTTSLKVFPAVDVDSDTLLLPHPYTVLIDTDVDRERLHSKWKVHIAASNVCFFYIALINTNLLLLCNVLLQGEAQGLGTKM